MPILGFRVSILRFSGVDFWILGFRVKGFQHSISNFGKGFSVPDFKFRKGFSELDFQNFDAQMPKIIPKSCFFFKISLEIQFFFARNSKNFVLGSDGTTCTTCSSRFYGDGTTSC